MELRLDPGLVLTGGSGANPVISFTSADTIWTEVPGTYNVTSKGAVVLTATGANEVIAPASPSTQTNSVLIHGVSIQSSSVSSTATLLDLINTNYATVEFASFAHPPGNTGDAIFTKSISPYADEYDRFIDLDFNVPGGRAFDIEDNTYIFTIEGGEIRAASDCVYLTAISSYGIDGGNITDLECINNTGYALDVGSNVSHVHWIGGRMESNISTGLINVGATGNSDLTLEGISILDNQAYGTDRGVVTWSDYNNANAHDEGFIAGSLGVRYSLDLPTTSSATVGVIRINTNPFFHAYGTANTFAGQFAGNFSLTGKGATGFGYYALNALTSGGNETAVGYDALYSVTSGVSNTGVGYQALKAATTSAANTAVGVNALQTISTSTGYNVAVGASALSADTASFNVALGEAALAANTSGSQNVAVGYSAGVTATPANENLSGSNNTWVGYQAGPLTSTQLSNSTALGNGALNSASDQMAFGNTSVTQNVFHGSILHAVNRVAYSTTPVIDLAKGDVQQFSCSTGGASIAPTIVNLNAGAQFTVIFVQNGTTACTWTWPMHIYGGMTVSATLSSINVQQFVVSANGSDAYALSVGSTGMTGGTP